MVGAFRFSVEYLYHLAPMHYGTVAILITIVIGIIIGGISSKYKKLTVMIFLPKMVVLHNSRINILALYGKLCSELIRVMMGIEKNHGEYELEKKQKLSQSCSLNDSP